MRSTQYIVFSSCCDWYSRQLQHFTRAGTVVYRCSFLLEVAALANLHLLSPSTASHTYSGAEQASIVLGTLKCGCTACST